MLERVPAAAESTAHFFLRSVEKPVRSSRVLDSRFWRNGVDDIESSAWWPSYLQRVRTVPQIGLPTCEDPVILTTPPSTRFSQSSFLRHRRDPTPHASLSSRPQQNGNALRSYSVSAPIGQSTKPQLADEFADERDQGYTNSSTRSRKIKKEQVGSLGNAYVDKTDSKKSVPKHSGQESRPEISVARPSNGKVKPVRNQITAFDLTTDTAPDRLNTDSVTHGMSRHEGDLEYLEPARTASSVRPALSHPSRDEDVENATLPGSNTSGKQNRVSSTKPLSRDAYKSFDLDSLHQDLAQDPAGAFDLETPIQYDRQSGRGSIQSPIEIDYMPSTSSTTTKSSVVDDPVVDFTVDLFGGWQHGNSFASLVPGQDLDDKTQEPSTTSSEGLTKQDKTPLDSLQDLAGTTVVKPPTKLSDVSNEPLERIEAPLETPKPQTETNDELSRKMAASLEASWVPLPGPDASPPAQTRPREPVTPQIQSLEIPSSDYKKTRFDALLRAKDNATAAQFDEAWSLFLSFDDQESLAPYMFRYLARSQDTKHQSRALAAFSLIPRPRRYRPMYQAAMYIELRRHQHGSATNLAFEANIRGFNILPELFAYLVKNLLWKSAAELLYRNTNARQEFAPLASTPEFSAVAERRMLTVPKLLEECNTITDLHTKVLSLAERIRAPDFVLMEHHGLLKMLCSRLIVQAVESPAVLRDITPQALLAVLDLGDHFDNTSLQSLHVTALNTIFQLPHRGDKLSLALTVYRNLRFKKLNEAPNSRIIKELIFLCGETEQTSNLLYDYLLDQFPYKPDVEAYHKVIVHCARRGNAQAVHKYLDLCIRDHGMPERVAFINPVIYVYAMAGNTTEARRQFDTLETNYGLKPDTVSWNILMLSHVRSDNDMSAFDVLEEMRQNNIKFNHYTYGQLLAVCAAHGDTEAALDVLVDARDDLVQVSVQMINTVIETFLKDDNPQAALRFAIAASDSKSKEGLTRLWNSFVRHFAFKGQVGHLMKIRRMMARHNVRPDGMTYAPLMALLTTKRRTSEAMRLLRQMHDQEKLPVTMLHYSIVLNGFVAEDNRDAAHLVFNEMKQRFPRISASANAAMLSLQARRDGRVNLQGPEMGGPYGVKMLAELVRDISSVEGSPFNAVSGRSHDRAAASLYFETIIRALIRSGSHDSAAQLVKHVDDSLIFNTEDKSGPSTSPRGMVLARLEATMERGDWVEFDKIWNAAFENAIKVNSSLPPIKEGHITEQRKSSAGFEAPSHAKYSLSSYLNRYMEAMARQFRVAEMRRFIYKKLLPAGFALSGKNWNKFVQVLCRSPSAKDQYQAFKVFEKEMEPRTQSWDLLVRGKIRKTTSTYLWQPYGQRNRPILQRQKNYRIVKRVDELRLRPAQRIPTYTTAVYLGSVLAQAYQKARQRDSRLLTLIRAGAPDTKRFIQLMPRLKDNIQGSILRQLSDQKEQKPRPRSEESFSRRADIADVTGDVSPLSRIPAEYLENVEEITGRGNVVRNLLKDNATRKSQRSQERKDVELGEMFTGQISRTPIMLAGQGRMETAAEMRRRISKEEQQKRDGIQLLREDLTARSLARDIYRLPLQAEPPPDFKDSQELDMEPQQADPAIVDILSLLGGQEAAGLSAISADKLDGALGAISLSQQIDDLAKKRKQGNQNLQAREERSEPIPPLAIAFTNQRRIRRRLALGQRKRARQLLEALKDHLSPRAYAIRTKAAKRLEAFERAQRRRRAVLAYERDLKAGKRLDPFPRTLHGYQRRRFMHGPVRVRFVPDLGRKARNYLARKGLVEERRQKRIQTLESKGKNYVTRWDRIQRWLDAHPVRRP